MSLDGGIIALGEALEDWVPSEDGTWHKLQGGAPLNLVCQASNLGVRSALITVLGCDEASERMRRRFEEYRLDLRAVRFDSDTVLCHTEVKVDPETGERKFRFFKDRASFAALRASDIKLDLLKDYTVFHCGTVALQNQGVIDAQLAACRMARALGMVVAFDPNLREGLFEGDTQIQLSRQFLSFAHILKVGEDEARVIAGIDDTEEAIKSLMSSYPELLLVVCTLGDKGIKLYSRNLDSIFVPAYKPKVIKDTVGCGDVTFGAFIASLIQAGMCGPEWLYSVSENTLAAALKTAAAAGSLQCEHSGAFPIPGAKEIQDRIEGA